LEWVFHPRTTSLINRLSPRDVSLQMNETEMLVCDTHVRDLRKAPTVTKWSLKEAQNGVKGSKCKGKKIALSRGWQRDLIEFFAR
jgi:hypothetical protein